ncbi:MAG: bacteriohemerythrin [Rhodospirillaceae bacterium]
MAIEWNDSLFLSHDLLDDDHREMAALINKLYLCVNENFGKDSVAAAARQLLRFSLAHFSHEKGLMGQYNYPDMAAHLSEHKTLVDELQGLIAIVESEGGPVRFETVDFLDDWFAAHLKDADARFAAFLAKEARETATGDRAG